MKDPRSRLTIAAVALILGFLVVAQFRGQAAGSGLENSTAQDLSQLVANLATRNDQLRSEVAVLQQQLATLQSIQSHGQTSAGQVRADLVRIRMWAGLEAAEGPGIRVAVHGPAPASVIGDLLNELRNAGAEAMAIGGVRVVAGTVIGGAAGQLSVENTPLTDPIDIVAIGNSAQLTGTLTRAGGVVAQVQATLTEVSVEVVPLTRVTVPATTRDLRPVDARPHP
jgi:uncharacterized protein YlxW (UPF0749 family)